MVILIVPLKVERRIRHDNILVCKKLDRASVNSAWRTRDAGGKIAELGWRAASARFTIRRHSNRCPQRLRGQRLVSTSPTPHARGSKKPALHLGNSFHEKLINRRFRHCLSI